MDPYLTAPCQNVNISDEFHVSDVYEVMNSGLFQKKRSGRGRRQAIYFSLGGWYGKFSNYMGHWCSTKSNYMGGWYCATWEGKKEYYLPKKKREVLSNLAKRKHRA